jgi:hypothetical protein
VCTSFWKWSGRRKPAEPRHQLSDTPNLRYFDFIQRSAWKGYSPKFTLVVFLQGGRVYRGRRADGPSGGEHATTTTREPPLIWARTKKRCACPEATRCGPAWRPVRDRAAPGRRDGRCPLQQERRPRGDQAGRRRRPPRSLRGRGRPHLGPRSHRLRRRLAGLLGGPSHELRPNGVLGRSRGHGRATLAPPILLFVAVWASSLAGRHKAKPSPVPQRERERFATPPGKCRAQPFRGCREGGKGR